MKVRETRDKNTNGDVLMNGNLAMNANGTAPTFAVDDAGKVWVDRKRLLRQDRGYWYVRRVQDIVLSLLALIVLFVPMLVMALVIWIDSPGASPIFKQTRVGRNGKTFEFLNFRWMKLWCIINKETEKFCGCIRAIRAKISEDEISDMISGAATE